MLDKIVHDKNYVAGWLDSSIHDFLEVLPASFQSMKYALLTCLDSNLDPRSLVKKSPELKSIAWTARSLKKGLILPTAILLEADASNQLFFGFDEVWFFPHADIEPKPDSAWLVGPARIDQRKLDLLGKWMIRNACSLALGDGDGLNFITKAHGLARRLLGHSLVQERPDLVPVSAADSA